MIIEIYRSYGVLSAENRPVYTADCAHGYASAWDKIRVALPEGFQAAENEFGEMLIETPWGATHLLKEILRTEDKVDDVEPGEDYPELVLIDADEIEQHFRLYEVKEDTEEDDTCISG